MQRIFCVHGHNVQIAYRPRLIRKNMITSVNIDGNPLHTELRNSYFQPTFVTVKIDDVVWELSSSIFDVIKEIKTACKDHKLARHLADYLFNRLGGVWQQLISRGLFVPSANLWAQVCQKTWEWEDTNGIQIHKGTPYYFLALTLMNLGDFDSAFAFIFNAIEEDKLSYSQTCSANKYKSSPAYMFATLVDDRANALYQYIKDMKKWILKRIRSYRKYTGLRFKYSDFESKFLREVQLEETVFLFVYQVLYILRQGILTPKRISQNEFSKLKNLNIIFNLCLIVDKAFEFRYRALPESKRDTLGKNVFNFFKEKNWITNERHAGDLKGEFTRSGANLEDDPDNFIPKLFVKNVLYHGNTVPNEMVPLLLTWHLRNYGGHNIKTQHILVNEYRRIVDFILYSLFLSLS